ncbi:alpha/beta-hydrolase [Trametes meyenii]|nr:alpha/beta-hydrolase [Trametes meyenii]
MAAGIPHPQRERESLVQVSAAHAYGPEAIHRFDYHYAPSPAPASPSPVLVFVHGGAWRSEDKADHAALARTLVGRTGCPVAVPNYRLTTQAAPHQHPSHAQDVLLFLHFLSTWPGPSPESPQPPPSHIYLLGHSCAAHILGSIFLASPYPELTPSPHLLSISRAILLSEGIYDIDALLRSFPTYKQWFIASAFGDHDAYPHVNVASYPLRPGAEHIRWLIIHSKGDVLVDQLQSESMHAHLSALAEGAPSNDRPGTMVEKTFDELEENHNELLRGAVYPRIIADFVARDAAPNPPSA